MSDGEAQRRRAGLEQPVLGGDADEGRHPVAVPAQHPADLHGAPAVDRQQEAQRQQAGQPAPGLGNASAAHRVAAGREWRRRCGCASRPARRPPRRRPRTCRPGRSRRRTARRAPCRRTRSCCPRWSPAPGLLTRLAADWAAWRVPLRRPGEADRHHVLEVGRQELEGAAEIAGRRLGRLGMDRIAGQLRPEARGRHARPCRGGSRCRSSPAGEPSGCRTRPTWQPAGRHPNPPRSPRAVRPPSASAPGAACRRPSPPTPCRSGARCQRPPRDR